MRTFVYCFCAITSLMHVVAIEFMEQIVHDALFNEEAAGNLGKGNQYLAERILARYSIHFPNLHFAVFAGGTSNMYWGRTDHNALYTYNNTMITAVHTAFNVDDRDLYATTNDCFGNLAEIFQSCNPLKTSCVPAIAENCEDDYKDMSKLDMVSIRGEKDVGFATTLPEHAFKDEVVEVKGKGSGRRWRVTIILQKNEQAVEERAFQTLLKNLTRIKARANGRFVSTHKTIGTLKATSGWATSLEQYLLVQNQDGTISLRANANGRWVAVDLRQGAKLVALSDNIGHLEKFGLENSTDNWHRLRARANGKLVSVDANGFLVADRKSADTDTEESTIFEFSTAVSAVRNGRVIEFPTVDDACMLAGGNGGFHLPYFFLFPLAFIFFVLVMALLTLSLYVHLMHKFDNIRGGIFVQVHAFWSMHLRKGLDRMLDSTAVDNECMLYSGPNSRVYFGRYRFAVDGHREVAVKVPSKEAFRMDMIIEETCINAHLRHPRIVEYIGYYRDAFRDMRIVSEFMAGGDLHTFLANKKNLLTVGHLYNYMCQIAEGMEYLASKRIIHRDLAARNCMLTRDCTSIKIADFGLSRHFNLGENYASSSPVKLPIRWTAMECLGENAEIMPNSKFSEKSDVWSFGIVVWECFTRGEMPYGSEEVRDVLGRMRAGWRLPRPEQCPLPLYEKLMLKCWNVEPVLRPDFSAVRQLGEEIFAQLITEEPETFANEEYKSASGVIAISVEAVAASAA